MNSDAPRISAAGQKIIERAMKERRRFRRVHLPLTGRLFIPATQEEATCTVREISPGDAAIICELKQEPKGRAVIYLENFGRFEGPIVRSEEGGFVVTFTCSLQKREKFADQLNLELNRHLLNETELRRFDRVEAVAGSFTHFTRSSGEQVRCEILDLSLSGVSVRTDIRPPVGEHVLVGHRAGRVARHHNDGIGVEFLGLPLNSGTGDPAAPAIAPPPRSMRTKSGKDSSEPAEPDTAVASARR